MLHFQRAWGRPGCCWKSKWKPVLSPNFSDDRSQNCSSPPRICCGAPTPGSISVLDFFTKAGALTKAQKAPLEQVHHPSTGSCPVPAGWAQCLPGSGTVGSSDPWPLTPGESQHFPAPLSLRPNPVLAPQTQNEG